MGGALEKSEKHAAAGNVAPAEPDLSTTQLPKADGLEVGTNDALNIVQAAEQEFTPDQYRRLLWKIDLVVLPLMWVCSGIQYADKASLSTQAIFGLREDTNLVGQQYSWLTTIFYLGYLIAEGPGNWILQRFHLGRTVAICMLIWGLLTLCIAFARTFADLMVLRALMGAAESTTYPALLILTSTWYTPPEHALRSLVWSTANAGMGTLTALINYAIGARAARGDAHALAPWQGIAFFLGPLTVALAALVYGALGTPREAAWLTPAERRMAQARVVGGGQTGSDARRWAWDARQVRVAARDPQTYFFFAVSLLDGIPNGGLGAFGSLVYVSFGFSPLEVLVKGTIPQNLLIIVWFVLVGYLTLKKPGLRFYFMLGSLIPNFAGLFALAFLPKDQEGLLWTRWGCYFITSLGTVVGPLMWTLLPSNVAGRTKKSVTSTVLLVAFCIGNCIGAQVFQDKDAPMYIPAIVVTAVMYSLEFAIVLAWRFYYQWQNNNRAQIVAQSGLTEEESLHQGRLNAESDMTDYENIHFRYSM